MYNVEFKLELCMILILLLNLVILGAMHGCIMIKCGNKL